jgi:hypothetical protein
LSLALTNNAIPAIAYRATQQDYSHIDKRRGDGGTRKTRGRWYCLLEFFHKTIPPSRCLVCNMIEEIYCIQWKILV